MRRRALRSVSTILVNIGTQHLDDHVFPGGQAGFVGLGQRSGAHGLRRETLESARQRTAKAGFHHGGDVFEWGWDGFVLQARQLPRDLRGEQIHPGTEELTQLDQDAAHVGGDITIATGNDLPAFEGRGTELVQQRKGEDDIPPNRLAEHPGRKSDNAAIALALDHGRVGVVDGH